MSHYFFCNKQSAIHDIAERVIDADKHHDIVLVNLPDAYQPDYAATPLRNVRDIASVIAALSISDDEKSELMRAATSEED